MDFKISRRQLDRILGNYWKNKFRNSYYGSENDWIGLFKKNQDGEIVQLVVRPQNSDETSWYFNGEVFYDDHLLLGLSLDEWRESLIRFLNKEFNLRIENLF